MPDLFLFLLIGLAVGLGAGAAQIGGPMRLSWRAGASVIYHRLARLPKGPPDRLGQASGAMVLILMLAGGALVAYAAAPSSPVPAPTRLDRLVGWMGSSVAEPLKDAAAAVPVQGEPAPLSPPADKMDGASMLTGTLRAEVTSGRWNGKPAWGLDQAQTERLIAYDLRREKSLADWYSKNWVAGLMARDVPSRPTPGEIYGKGLADFQALDQLRTNYRVAHFADEMNTPITGPSAVYVRPDQIPREVLTEAGADPRGTWSLGPADENGGRTLTRIQSNSPDPGVMTSAMSISNWPTRNLGRSKSGRRPCHGPARFIENNAIKMDHALWVGRRPVGARDFVADLGRLLD